MPEAFTYELMSVLTLSPMTRSQSKVSLQNSKILQNVQNGICKVVEQIWKEISVTLFMKSMKFKLHSTATWPGLIWIFKIRLDFQD